MTALRQRMLEDLHLRNYSPQPLDCSLRCVASFAQDLATPPDRLGAAHIRQYQLYLVHEKHASWSLVIQTVAALRFFYHSTLRQPGMIDDRPQPKRPKTLPTILRPAAVAILLQAPHRLKRGPSSPPCMPLAAASPLSAPGDGHRQSPPGAVHPAGQRAAGALRHVVAAVARTSAAVLAAG